ncbi:unnamed protein product [Nezara viridula]|uniref:Uncharacterized protein n=1 Tax=Nezara viridula TaxID=85310 RepID=A0A9P0EB80_NEZVI|nr:unnamed protein product [Nezara viridula]
MVGSRKTVVTSDHVGVNWIHKKYEVLGAIPDLMREGRMVNVSPNDAATYKDLQLHHQSQQLVQDTNPQQPTTISTSSSFNFMDLKLKKNSNFEPNGSESLLRDAELKLWKSAKSNDYRPLKNRPGTALGTLVIGKRFPKLEESGEKARQLPF